MARLQQLKMLLWKNLQVKRRMPIILILETIIPFVLFVLLGLVRYQEPLMRIKTHAPRATPLPSTGIASMVQNFLCDDVPSDGDGLPYLTENSTYFKFLTRINELYRIIEGHNPQQPDEVVNTLAEIAYDLPLSDTCKNTSSSSANLTQLLYGGIARFYQTLCNTNQTSHVIPADDNSTVTPESMFFGSKRFSAFTMFWEKFLNGQLKILYTPGQSSAVKNVIKTVNSSSFEMVDRLTEHAEHWLTNTSLFLHRHFADTQEKLEKLDLIDSAACWWLNLITNANFSVFVPFDKEYEAVDYSIIQAPKDNLTVYAVVVFNVSERAKNLPPHTSYKIRMNSTYLYSVKKLRPLYWSPMPRNWDYFYYTSGFMFLQDAIDRAIITNLVGYKVVEPGTMTRNVPMPCYLYDIFLFTNSMILPLCMTISYVYAAAILVQNIVSEKENGLKEFMKVMGLSNAVHGAAWFITAFAQLTLSVTVVTLILVFSSVLAHSDPLIIWIILEIYAVATITFSFLVSSLFSKAKIASAAGGMLYFLSYVPSMTISLQEDFAGIPIPPAFKILASFLSTSAFGLSCKYIGLRESEGQGVQWDNLSTSPIEHDSFTLFHSVGMLIVDVFLYAVLAWYIENVKPGDFGIAKPWYFPISKAYWTGEDTYHMPACLETCCTWASGLCNKVKFGKSIGEDNSSNNHEMQSTAEPNCNNYEPDPTDLPLGVEIDHLTKVYDKRKVAVNNLSLKLYESQITALLGHNGAGKSSTMSVLCGLHGPTTGTVRIYGLDIKEHLDKVRNSVGYCPQHNILIDYLTPEEHLRFYSGLKRNSKPMSKEDIESILEDVGLTQKKSAVVAHLSGGMKRKLSIALAFLGNSRLVILDEPTAGVDPYSRRAIWELLIKYKKGRTIVMSTHFMQEADILSDRIALISNGSLKCCGSSMYLRSHFCEGYHLVCVKDDKSTNVAENCTSFVKDILVSAYLSLETKDELHFVIPYGEERDSKIVSFFHEFDKSAKDLGVVSFGIYDSTLEEAFLKITEATNANCDSTAELMPSNGQTPQSVPLNTATSRDVISPLVLDALSAQHYHPTGCSFFTHFRALMIKRFIHVRRSWKVLFSQIFLPAVFIATAMSMSLSASLTGNPPPFALIPSQYNIISQPVGIFTPTTNYAVRPDHPPTNVTGSDGWIDAGATAILQATHFLSGLSASCALNSTTGSISDLYTYGNVTNKQMSKFFVHGCNQVFTENVPLSGFKPREYDLQEPDYYPICSCLSDGSGFSCPNTASPPPHSRMITGDHLIDIGSQNMSEYILHTTNDFKLHRYGGLNFGLELSHIPETFGDGIASDLRKLAVRRIAVAYFDNRGFHAQPIYLNVINNAILRANINKRPELGNPAAYGITTYNHPINGTDKVSDQDLAVQGSDMIIAVFIIIAMSFVPASFVVFAVYERSLLVKHIQFMTGLHPVTYWLANYVWDLLNYLIPAVCCILILLAFNVPAYVAGDNISAVIGLFLLYGWSMTPTMYPMSFLLNEPSKAYVLLVVLNLFIGTTCLIATSLLDIFTKTPSLKDANDVLKVAFLPVPSYCLGRGIMDVALNHYTNQFYKLAGKYDKVTSPLTWSVVLQKYLAMIIEGFACFALTIVLEIMSRRNIFPKCTRVDSDADEQATVIEGEDADVTAERKRILLGGSPDDLLVIDRLSKEFRPKSGPVLAVDRLTIGLSQGQCFGLLGLNGAGKSTTFSMLSGICNATSGEARLGGELLCSSRMPSPKILRKIGYCPQTDPLLEELTGREHLQFYARIHNVPSSMEAVVVDSLLEKMGLEPFADKPTRTYSGGMKRKLSAALALVGNPLVVLLDEPTTGMDPTSRRFLWNVILRLRQEGRLVVLTSHSMEECEALCSRLAVMVAGRLKCIGSTQHLKDKFGKGYTITLRLPKDVADFDKEAVFQVFNHYGIASHFWRVIAQRHQIIELALMTSRPNFEQLFQALTNLKETGTVAEFSVSQNTLDSVFLFLANNKDRHPSLMIGSS